MCAAVFRKRLIDCQKIPPDFLEPGSLLILCRETDPQGKHGNERAQADIFRFDDFFMLCCAGFDGGGNFCL